VTNLKRLGFHPSSIIARIALSPGAPPMDVLKVSAKSNPSSVAGALAGVLREHGRAEMQAIGAGAINQAVKAVAIARGYVAPSGLDLVCVPAFIDLVIDGEERTAIKLIVEPR
jgi:stage V sporulation protein S